MDKLPVLIAVCCLVFSFVLASCNDGDDDDDDSQPDAGNINSCADAVNEFDKCLSSCGEKLLCLVKCGQYYTEAGAIFDDYCDLECLEGCYANVESCFEGCGADDFNCWMNCDLNIGDCAADC